MIEIDVKIYDYLTKEKNNSPVVANLIGNKVCKYDDIKNEFLEWLKTRSYDFDAPLSVAGYTARDIAKMAPFMDGIGVYTFMVSLRDEPKKALEYVKEGFPVR